MPSIRDVRSIAISGTVVNILAGSKFEFMPVPAAVLVYACGDLPNLATGAPAVVMDVSFGNVIEGDAIGVPVFTAGFGPNTDEHLVASGVAAAGDRLVIKMVNGDAAAVAPTRVLVKINPL